jgi:hypothetical protein
MNIRLVDEIYLDLRSASDWYEEKRGGLGDEFVDLFFTIAEGLPNVALHCSTDETGYRPKRMPRFTAVIYYHLADSEIVVVGVLVNGRSSSNLKGRGSQSVRSERQLEE